MGLIRGVPDPTILNVAESIGKDVAGWFEGVETMIKQARGGSNNTEKPEMRHVGDAVKELKDAIAKFQEKPQVIKIQNERDPTKSYDWSQIYVLTGFFLLVLYTISSATNNP